jgi:SnoaL-like domain
MSNSRADHTVSNDPERSTPMHDEKTTTNRADEAAVRDLYQQLMNGWNRGSGEAFAAAFTEDGDLVAFDGTHFEGREEIAPSTRSSSPSG